ncbi:MAG: PEP-CTERM sorting domain-containing protein [Akkermansia sp.]|nr:PEP-CTERM sorting domain-containing protein [Akkermansia sp.]
MKTRLPQLLLAILLSSAAVQAATWTTEEGANCSFDNADQKYFGRTIVTENGKTVLVYDNLRDDSKTLNIKDCTIDTTGYDEFRTTTSKKSPVVFANTVIEGNDVTFDGTVRFQASSELNAENVTLKGSSLVRNNAKISASDTVVISGTTAILFGATVEAKTISLESTGGVQEASLTADTVKLNGSSVEIGGSKKAVINAKQIEVNSGTLTVAGDAELSTNSITLNGGKLVNSGSIESTINMTGGTLVAEAGSAIAGINATGGDIQVDGNFSMTGDLVLDGDAELIFADVDSSIDLGNYDLVLNGGSIALTLADADIANVVLFTGAKEGSYSGYEVTLLDAEGNSTGTAVMKYNANGDITLGTAAVPEPTTATLSLLALAALATRRRRR